MEKMDKKKQMYGKKGEDLIIKVPVGTQVRDFTTGKLILDMNVMVSKEFY